MKQTSETLDLEHIIQEKGDMYDNYEKWQKINALDRDIVICTNATISFSNINQLLKLLKSFKNTDIILSNKYLISNCNTSFLNQFFLKMNSIATRNNCTIYLNLTFTDDNKLYSTCFSIDDILFNISNYRSIQILNNNSNVFDKDTKVFNWNYPINDIKSLSSFLKFYNKIDNSFSKSVLLINQEIKLTSKYMTNDLSSADFSSVIAQFCNFRKFNRVFSINNIQDNYTNERIVSMGGKKNGSFNLFKINKCDFTIIDSWEVSI